MTPLAITMRLSATEFKARCLELMDDVATRRIRYVVTKHGVPVAELVPTGDDFASPIGFLHGTAIEHGDLVAPDPTEWREVSDPLDEA